MATLRTIQGPKELAGASVCALSRDGKTVACRVEGDHAGLWAYDVSGGAPRAVRLDAPGRRHESPAWSAAGDLMFRVDVPGGSLVGVAPAPGRGGPQEFPGSSGVVSEDGRILAVADGRDGLVRVGEAEPGNAPFAEPLRELSRAAASRIDPGAALDVTRDGAHVVVVRHSAPDAPSLWAHPLDGGDAQEIISELPAPAFLSFALFADKLAVIEIRRGAASSSRVYVRPLAAGSLSALRLGPARDLIFVRQELSEQRPDFSPDGARLAVMGAVGAPLPGAGPTTSALDLFPTAGGHPLRAMQSFAVGGSARFLSSGEVVVDGVGSVAVVTL